MGGARGTSRCRRMDTVKFWLLLQPYYGNDAERRSSTCSTSPARCRGQASSSTWRYGSNGGLLPGRRLPGAPAAGGNCCATDGYATNMLWVEPPGNYGLAGLMPAAETSTRPPGRRAPAPRQARRQRKAIADPGHVPADRGAATSATRSTTRLCSAFRAHPGELGRAVRRPGQGRRAVGERRRVGHPLPSTRAIPGRRMATAARAGATPPAPCPGTSAYLQHLGVGMTVWTLERRRARHRHHGRVRPLAHSPRRRR